MIQSHNTGYDFGLSISKKLAEKYSFSYDYPAEIFPSQNCVYTVITAEGIPSCEDLKPTIDWMNEHNFTLKNDIIGKVLNVTFDRGKEYRNYEIWIPCD